MQKIILALLLSTSLHTKTLYIGERRSEKKPFSEFPKMFFGDYLSSQITDFSIYYDSAMMVLEQQTTSYYTDIHLIPGNTYYYFYKTTTPTKDYLDQREPHYRLIYISSEPTGVNVYIDGKWKGGLAQLKNIVVYDDWGYPSTPLPPEKITSYFSYEKNKWCIRLIWSCPEFKDEPIVDVFGGFYQIYRSTYSDSFKEEKYLLIATIPAYELVSTYLDEDIDLSTSLTYYYVLKTADAYEPPTISIPSRVVRPIEFLRPIIVVFNVDVSKIKNVEKVSLAGCFTNWRKIQMINNYDGTFSLQYYDPTRIFDGTTIEYKYIINETIWENDFPELLSGPNRKVTLIDDNNDGFVFLHDIFNVPTTTVTASNLPEEIVSFFTEPEENLVKLIWEINPPEVKKVKDVLIYSAKEEPKNFTEFIKITTPAAYQIISDTTVSNGTTVYYRIQITRQDGTVSYISDPVKSIPPFYSDYIPKYTIITATQTDLIDYTATHGIETASIELSWLNPEGLKDLGPPTHYIVRISTFPIKNFDEFRRQKLYVKSRSHTPLTKEFLKVIIQENGAPLNTCPSLFFTIGSIYGINYLNISQSLLSVAGVYFTTKQSTTVIKGNKSFGTIIEPYNATLTLKKNSLQIKSGVCVIRNYYELMHSKLKEKINQANEYAKKDIKLKFIPENELINHPHPDNTIFSFEIYSNQHQLYFTDENEDGLPDKKFINPVSISIPYSLPYPPELMRLYCLSEKINRWYLVKDVNLIPSSDKIQIENLRYLGVFALFPLGIAREDLADALIFPNPFIPFDGDWRNGEANHEYNKIMFYNLTPNTEISIYTIAMELVKYHKLTGADDDEKRGIWQWNWRNENNKEVASGVYLCLLKDEKAEKEGKVGKKIEKLVIIK